MICPLAPSEQQNYVCKRQLCQGKAKEPNCFPLGTPFGSFAFGDSRIFLRIDPSATVRPGATNKAKTPFSILWRIDPSATAYDLLECQEIVHFQYPLADRSLYYVG